MENIPVFGVFSASEFTRLPEIRADGERGREVAGRGMVARTGRAVGDGKQEPAKSRGDIHRSSV